MSAPALVDFLLARIAEDEDGARGELSTTAQSALGVQWLDLMRRVPQAPLSIDARAAVDWQSIAADGQPLPSRCDDTRTLPFVPGYAPEMPRWGGCIDNAAGDLLRRIGGTRE